MKCPRCGAECEQDEVDIGVGVQTGPPYCPDCGWHNIEPEIEDIVDKEER